MTELEKLVEKDAIRDQYYVYARALDRIDNPLGKTVFAEDAQVDYGPTYKGTGYGFIDMMLKMHRKMVSTHHVMTNILIKLNEDGTKAAAEAYYEDGCDGDCDNCEHYDWCPAEEEDEDDKVLFKGVTQGDVKNAAKGGVELARETALAARDLKEALDDITGGMNLKELLK